VITRTIRSATVGDVAALSSVHIASSDDAYAPLAGSWPVDNVGALTTAKWFEILGKHDEIAPDGPSRLAALRERERRAVGE
jgi:hypothetical protein